MDITLTKNDIEAIARRTAELVTKKLNKAYEAPPKMVSSAEAAKILGISVGRMRKIAYRYPHIKRSDNKQGQLLFDREALLK